MDTLLNDKGEPFEKKVIVPSLAILDSHGEPINEKKLHRFGDFSATKDVKITSFKLDVDVGF